MAEVPSFPRNNSSEQPDIHRYLDVVRRRHMHFLITATSWVAGSLGSRLGFAATL